MTIETQLNLVFYSADGVATVFPFTFPVYDETHLRVILQDVFTYAQVQLNDSEYNITGIGNENGGSVVTIDPPPSGVNVLIARILPFQQDLDVLNQGGFYPENIENEFDLTEMQIQQLNEEQNRSVRGILGEIWPELPGPPPRRGMLLGFVDDETAYPTVDTLGILFNLLLQILQAGFGIRLDIDTVNHTITIVNTMPGSGVNESSWLLESSAGGGTGGADANAEEIRDVIGLALQGLGCVIVVDDAANTITVDCTQDATAEVIRDVMGVSLVAGSGITITPSDVGNTITIAATGGVGGFQPLSATLTGIAAEGPTAANQLIYSVGVDAFDKTTLTPFMRTLLDDANAAAALVTLGIVAGGSGTFSANTLSVTIPLASGSLLIQGGTGTIGGDSSATKTFPTAYSVAPVVVVSGGAASSGEGDVHISNNPSTTGVALYNSRGGTVTYNWIAVGKA